MNNPFSCKNLLKTSLFKDFLEIICEFEMERSGWMGEIIKAPHNAGAFVDN